MRPFSCRGPSLAPLFPSLAGGCRGRDLGLSRPSLLHGAGEVLLLVLHERKVDGEGRSLSRNTLHVNLATMVLDDPVGNGQAKPGPLGLLGAEEGIEYFGQVLR